MVAGYFYEELAAPALPKRGNEAVLRPAGTLVIYYRCRKQGAWPLLDPDFGSHAILVVNYAEIIAGCAQERSSIQVQGMGAPLSTFARLKTWPDTLFG
jgi:hypothetical protein